MWFLNGPLILLWDVFFVYLIMFIPRWSEHYSISLPSAYFTFCVHLINSIHFYTTTWLLAGLLAPDLHHHEFDIFRLVIPPGKSHTLTPLVTIHKDIAKVGHAAVLQHVFNQYYHSKQNYLVLCLFTSCFQTGSVVILSVCNGRRAALYVMFQLK